MNTLGSSMLLQDLSGRIADNGQNRVLCVAIKTALTGSLTISGLTTGNSAPNSPADWVLAPGSVGAYTHSGNGHSGGGALNYSLNNAADQGKAVIAWAGS